MLIEINRQVTINAPARKVWRVVAHQFDQIGDGRLLFHARRP